MTLCGIFEGVVANFLFGLILVIFGLIWVILTHRRDLQIFFGTLKSKRLNIYISNIRVQPFGSIGVTGRRLSYGKDSVDYGEMQIANYIQRLFRSVIPKLTEVSKPIGSLLLSDVEVRIVSSPKEINDLDAEAPFISIGSTAFNISSKYIEDTGINLVKFSQGELSLAEIQEISPVPSGSQSSTDPSNYGSATGIDVQSLNDISDPPIQPFDKPCVENNTYPNTGMGPTGVSFPTEPNSNNELNSAIIIDGIPFTDNSMCIVERIVDPEKDRFLFYAAGLTEESTISAAYFLATKWYELHKKYKGNQPFLLVLKADPLNFKNSSVIFERTNTN